MNAEKQKQAPAPARLSASLLLMGSVVLLSCALLYNEFILGILDPRPPLSPRTLHTVRKVEAIFLGLGLLGLAARWAACRIPRTRKALEHPVTPRLLLVVMTVLLPLLILELSLTPYLTKHKKTTIFVPDSALGWRLRPNARDLWSGVEIAINGKGLRGPELPYQKPEGSYRILYLGDSVTFGYGIENDQDTYPYQIESILEDRQELTVETVNAGVGGYAPWQEYLFLATEGIKYDPDLVVIGFVLNDVSLVRGGPWRTGFQLRRSVLSRLDMWINKSAVLYFGREFAGRLRFGSDTRAGATKSQLLDVRALVEEPDREDVRRAWDLTLTDLDQIVQFCKERGIQTLILAFPFDFQLRDPASSRAPQDRLAAYAARRGVKVVDLLYSLSERSRGTDEGIRKYFMDEDHLTIDGCKFVATEISPLIAELLAVSRVNEPNVGSASPRPSSDN